MIQSPEIKQNGNTYSMMQDPILTDKYQKYNETHKNNNSNLELEIKSDRSFDQKYNKKFDLDSIRNKNINHQYELDTMKSGDQVNIQDMCSDRKKGLSPSKNTIIPNNSSPGQNVKIISLLSSKDEIMSNRIMSDGELDERSATKLMLKKPATVKHRNVREKSRFSRG